MHNMKTTPQQKPLLYTSLCCASLYWINCESPNALSIPFKVASTALLTCYHHLNQTTENISSLTISLASHTIGDLLIELSEDSLTLSLIAFFIGHGFYAKQLYDHRIPFHEITPIKAGVIGLLGAYALWFGKLLVSHTDGIVQKAIPAYCAMLFAVLSLAVLQKEKPLKAALAAGSYALSDSLIGTNLFIRKLPSIGYLTWSAYFCGQLTAVSRHLTFSDDANSSDTPTKSSYCNIPR